MTVIIWLIIICLVYWKHRAGVSALPEHLRYKIHNDWDFVFELIPRSLTAYKLTNVPKTVWHYNCTQYQEHNGELGLHPIQTKLNGKMFSAHLNFPCLFFSLTTKWGWYFIIGIRWDAVDFYYNFPTIDISKAEKFEA
jgi:hypothetical protein